MNDIWQKNGVNPSHHTMLGDYEDDNWNLSLPTYAQGILHSGPSLEHLYRIDSDTILVITPQNWINQLDENNVLSTSLNFQTFNLSYRLNNMIISVGHSFHTDFSFSYSKDLMTFLANGNARSIHEPLELGHDLSANIYGKWSLGLAKRSDKLDLGIRLNILNGIQHLSTPKTGISLTTDDDIYQLQFQMDYELRSAGQFDLTDINDPIFFNSPSFSESFTSNIGYSVDIGFDWHPSEKLSFEGAILDIGKIEWTQNTAVYKLEGEYKFEGVDIFNNNLDSFQISQVADSLIKAFDLEPNSREAFTTSLPWTLSLQAQYSLNDRLELQALFANHFGSNSYQTIAFGLNYRVIKGINLGVNYAINAGSHQLGLNSSFRWKHIQFFAATDNILGLHNISYSLNSGVLVGMSLYF